MHDVLARARQVTAPPLKVPLTPCRQLDAFRAAGTGFKAVEQGAATSVLLAASPLLEGVGGRYFENCNEAVQVERRGKPGQGGVAPYALDPANAERLWELSLKLIQ